MLLPQFPLVRWHLDRGSPNVEHTKETNMACWLARTASLFALLLLAGLAVGQAEWSAVVVDPRKEGAPTVLKIYFGREKVRLEPQMWVRGTAPGPFILFDRTTHKGTVVVPENHAYIDAPPIGTGLARRNSAPKCG